MAREEKEKKGFFSKLKESLSRTRDNLSGRVDQLVRPITRSWTTIFTTSCWIY